MHCCVSVWPAWTDGAPCARRVRVDDAATCTRRADRALARREGRELVPLLKRVSCCRLFRMEIFPSAIFPVVFAANCVHICFVFRESDAVIANRLSVYPFWRPVTLDDR